MSLVTMEIKLWLSHSHQRYCSRSLVYLLYSIGHFTDYFAWWQAAQQLLLLYTAVSQGSHILFQYITVNNRFLLKGAGSGFFWLANMSSHPTKNAVHCSLGVCWCNWRHYILCENYYFVLSLLAELKAAFVQIWWMWGPQLHFLFCCKKKTVNYSLNCLLGELLHCLAGKGHRFSREWTGDQTRLAVDV
jgi:hypothetical protein